MNSSDFNDEKYDVEIESTIADRLRLIITGNERVLWTGKTESYAKNNRKTIFIVVMLVFMGAVLFHMVKTLLSVPLLALIDIIPIFILLVIFKAFLSQKRCGYAITDRRLIIFHDNTENSVALIHIHDVQVEYGNQNTGTIIIRRVDNPYSRRAAEHFDNFFIQGVADPDEVYRKLSEAIDLARKTNAG